MAKTKIEWADMVWNPAVGCTPAGVGCLNCYAKRVYERFHPGQKFSDIHLYPQKLYDPLGWKKPQLIFVDSMFDLFHKDISHVFIAQVFAIAAIARQHTYVVLTKRIDRALQILDCYSDFDNEVEAWQEQFCHERGYCPQEFEWPLPNVWLLTSISTQEDADENIPLLLQTPAAVRGVSVEPMLEKIVLPTYWQYSQPDGFENNGPGSWNIGGWAEDINWVICGCESGPGARPMELDWVRSLRDQCQEADVPFFLKQARVNGKLVKMPELDGKVWAEYPK
jgi:protein gp37